MAVAEHAGREGRPSDRLGRRTASNLATWTRTLLHARRGRSAPRVPAVWLGLTALVCVVFAVATSMLAFDARLIALQRSIPSGVVKAFHIITDLGKSGWILLPLGAGLVFVAALSSQRLRAMHRLVLIALASRLGFVFAAVALPGLAVTVVKRIVGRQRPNVWAETSPFDYIPFHGSSEFASFPSGHSTTAFATAIAIGALYPRLRAPLLGLAFVIAASRVAISTHYPSDVIAGAVVGSIGALMVRHWFALRRLGFAVDGAGAVRPMEGPTWKRLKAAFGATRRA